MICPLCLKRILKHDPLVPVSRISYYKNSYWVEIIQSAAHAECYKNRRELKK